MPQGLHDDGLCCGVEIFGTPKSMALTMAYASMRS
jgi:hypothetical protein